MPTYPSPSLGCVVIFLNPDPTHPHTYLHGVVTGPHVVDPETGHSWVPVLLPDRSAAVVDTKYVLRVRRAGQDGSPA
jgi:hypothetical protein